MILFVDEIIVPERFRKDFGDIEELAEDIRQNGLISPIVIDQKKVLLAGERRLRAVKSLGWEMVEVHVMETRDDEHELNIELSENDKRKDFNKEERAELMKKRLEIKKAKAKERQLENLMQNANDSVRVILPERGRSDEMTAKEFGVSASTMKKEIAIVDGKELLDPADFAEWSEGRLSTNKAYQMVKAREAKLEQETERLQAENETLREQVKELESREPQVIEKTVEVSVEVVPEDYEDLKRQAERAEESQKETREVTQKYYAEREKAQKARQEAETLKTDCSNLKKRAEHAERERLETNEELNEAKRKIKDYESRKDILEMQKKLEEEAGFFTIRTYDYIQKNGGNVWITQRLMQLPDDKRKEFIDSIFAIDAFAQQMIANIGGYGIERTKE